MSMLTAIMREVDSYLKHAPPAPQNPDEPNPRDLWLETARNDQLPPPGEWFTWLIMAGRGWGKTRTGAETIAEWAREQSGGRWALIAQTAADARDVMLEGESGLLRVLAPSELRGGTYDTAYNRSLGELHLADGGKFKAYTAEKPRQLRGPQHHGAWLDEPATWLDAHRGAAEDTTYSNLQFGLRLGGNPRQVVTGTPRPVRLIREIMADPGTVITRGSTYDNLANLAPQFRDKILARYEGTRLGRQELSGELLEDTPGALWQWAMFGADGFRLTAAPPLSRIVVGVDPAASSTDEADMTGIIVAGLGQDGRGYVLADATLRGTPNEWGQAATAAARAWRADRVVAERNNGGQMVEYVLRSIAPNLPITTVWASRGKQTRAEPVAALYEQGKVSHVGLLPELETQLTSWAPDSEKSPDRLDACFAADTLITTDKGDVPIELIKPGMMVLTRQGYRRVVRAEMTNPAADVLTLQASNGVQLTGTGNHPIWVKGKGFTYMDALVWGDILETCQENPLSSMESSTTASQIRPIALFGSTFTQTINLCEEPVKMHFTAQFGCITTAPYQRVITSTTETGTRLTTRQRIWNSSALHFIRNFMRQNSEIFAAPILSAFGLSPQRGTVAQRLKRCIRASARSLGKVARLTLVPARTAGNLLRRTLRARAFVRVPASIEMPSINEPTTKLAPVRDVVRSSAPEEVSPSAHAPVSVLGLSESGKASVYNLEVEEVHEYYANGVLVHNCVWALTELMLGEESGPRKTTPLAKPKSYA